MKKLVFICLFSFITIPFLNAQSNNQTGYLNSDEWKDVVSNFSKIMEHNNQVVSSEQRKSTEIGPEFNDYSVITMLTSTETTELFNEVLKSSGLIPYFESEGPFTFVVPNDDAMKALEREDSDALFTEKDLLVIRSFVLDHVFPGKLSRQDLFRSLPMRSLSNQSITFSESSNDQINFGILNLGANNGVVHVIDRTLLQ